MKRKLRPLAWLSAIFLVLMTAYVVAYLGLSRRGYAEADRYDLLGFYYLPAEDTDAWRFRNHACVVFFYPLNEIDQWLGFGRYPAYEPVFSIPPDPPPAR
jgi:hypothetical protein